MKKSGFTLIQLSIILTVASLIFVATLPGIQTSLKSSATSVTKMNSILNTMRGYMAANGYLPCPADPTQAIGASNYGVAAANSGSTNNCIGGTPAAAYADTTNHIAIGMVPVKTLGLSYADALDGYGRDITYAVDTNATATCWSSNSLTGGITVNDNGINYNTVAVLVSHGADGYGAWLPLSGTSGSASRFDNGSTDTSQADNAQVAHGGGLTANTTFASFVRKTATSTFDDSMVYKSNLYTLNTLPASAQVYPAITPPSNGTYATGNVLTFTITYASTVTVNTANGTPRLDLSALGTGSIGTSNKAYATYQSGSGTTALTFSYTVQGTDSAPTSGLTMNAWIDLNGGTISGGSTCFTAPGLTSVLITPTYYRTVTIDHTKVGTVSNTDQTSFPVLFSGTYSYLATTAHGGMVTNSSGYDITFTSDAAGNNLLPFERKSWNATTGASVFWVQVPTVSHSADTVIYLHYGNSSITTDQSNASGTWDSNFKGVWHLDDNAANTTVADSTSNANTGTNAANTSTKTTSGEVGGALSYNGTSDLTTIADNVTLEATSNLTISAWIEPTSWTASSKIEIYRKDTDYLLKHSASGDGTACADKLTLIWWDGTNKMAICTANPSTGAWHYIVGVVSGNAAVGLYVDGSLASSTVNNLGAQARSLTLPEYFGGSPSTNFSGNMDEIRMSNYARSADWVKTEYNNQSAPDKATYGASGFYTVGAQTSR